MDQFWELSMKWNFVKGLQNGSKFHGGAYTNTVIKVKLCLV